jgi:multiple sugar transport system ATP-binding protein
MASIDLAGVTKSFPDGTLAVSDVNLSLVDGELLVLVGPSGCGKSTILRLIAGLEDLTSGTVRIGGTVVNDLPPQERNVAMVFQDYALYPHMTVRGNLEFPLRMRKLGADALRARVARVAEQLDLTALLDRRPKQLSGGQRQRVAMGRALVREPAASLLDEPLSNLDARLRVQVRAELAELQRRTRTTMIYVTHDQVEAMTLGQRVAVLHHGQLQQVATPHDLYQQPANVFVAGFIGTPPMNLLPAEVERRASQLIVRIGNHAVAGLSGPLAAAVTAAGPEARYTAGIRPEALRLVSESASGCLPALVQHVEYLGHETLLHVRTLDPDGLPLTARLADQHAFARGERIGLAFDSGQLHLFNAAGRALPVGDVTP